MGSLSWALFVFSPLTFFYFSFYSSLFYILFLLLPFSFLLIFFYFYYFFSAIAGRARAQQAAQKVHNNLNFFHPQVQKWATYGSYRFSMEEGKKDFKLFCDAIMRLFEAIKPSRRSKWPVGGTALTC